MGIELTQASYRRLRTHLLEGTKPVVLWCGAGLSKPAGLPDWRELKNRLTEDLDSKASSFGDNESERSRLSNIADRVENEKNMWTSFTLLQEGLGQTSFKESVREHLLYDSNIDVPENYIKFWQSNIHGIVNLNLDRFASRAHFNSNLKRNFIEINGQQIRHSANVLNTKYDFVINLHGTLEDSDSWVLTREQLKSLISDASYTSTLSNLFSNYAILYVGISADDIAAGGFLHALTSQNIDLRNHFWLTGRNDRETDAWAESAGMQIIRYSVEEGHEAAYEAIFEDLFKFTPKDEPAPPVRTSKFDAISRIADADELSREDPETIRKSLAAHARDILDRGTEAVPEEYANFIESYSRAIHNAWYISDKRPHNKFFGYEIEEGIGDGAFSHVYKAKNSDNERCAIKLMKPELMNDPDMLGSFRRGINSMQILQKNHLYGMVKLLDAVELPCAIFMEYVDGPTLEEVVEARILDPWDDGLKFAIDIADIIRNGHSLPESVLHRDIRPSNIMLRNFYNPEEETEVVVLDFDLSWHRGAYDVSLKQHAQTALGYLAPEQIYINSQSSTRHASVDAYGLSATLYFLFTGEHPRSGLFEVPEFDKELQRKIAPTNANHPYCIKNRIFRLIKSGVSFNQQDRLDFSEIINELKLVYKACIDIESVNSPEFWAEEMMCYARGADGYAFDADAICFNAALVSGMLISGKPDYVKDTLNFHFAYNPTADVDRRNVTKFLEARIPEVTSMLRNSGFEIVGGPPEIWSSSFSFHTKIDTESARKNSKVVGDSLKRAIERLNVN